MFAYVGSIQNLKDLKVDLNGVDLGGKDRRGAWFWVARFCGVLNVVMVTPIGVDLCSAILDGADLRGFDLRWIDLAGIA